MTKDNVVAFVLAILSVLFLSDFKCLNLVFLVPNVFWVVPFYLFFTVNILYFKISFKNHKNILLKILLMFFNFLVLIALLYLGFLVWKINHGNILTKEVQEFHINIKNIWFWCIYQSYLILLFLSAFKQLVTIA